jgi:hypothetical protein
MGNEIAVQEKLTDAEMIAHFGADIIEEIKRESTKYALYGLCGMPPKRKRLIGEGYRYDIKSIEGKTFNIYFYYTARWKKNHVYVNTDSIIEYNWYLFLDYDKGAKIKSKHNEICKINREWWNY